MESNIIILLLKKNLTWCPCFSHIRRKFIEAEGTDPKLRVVGLDIIQQLFKIEESASDLLEAERLETRRIKSEPLIDELINLANSNI